MSSYFYYNKYTIIQVRQGNNTWIGSTQSCDNVCREYAVFENNKEIGLITLN